MGFLALVAIYIFAVSCEELLDPAPTEPEDTRKYGAIAYGFVSNDYKYYISVGHSTSEAAELEALRRCGGGCEIQRVFSNSCAALWLGETQTKLWIGYVIYPDQRTAEDSALSECRETATNCNIVSSACSR